MAGKPFFLRVLRAVSESALDADARHIVMVMAVYAQSRTGVGLHSQETLARLTGRSERHVRAILADLSRADAAPIRIQRRPRFRADGRGRTSDEWRLTLTTDQPAPGAAYSDDQPAHDAGKPPGLTGTPRLTNRHATSDQPAPGAGDLRCDRRSDRRSSSASTSEAGSFALSSPSPQTATRPSKKTPRATKPKSKNGPAHATVTKFYFEAFRAKRGTDPVGFDGADGRAIAKLLEKNNGDADAACKVITGAFACWKGDTVTIRQIASNPSEFIGAPRARTNGTGPVQPSYGVVNEEKYS